MIKRIYILLENNEELENSDVVVKAIEEGKLIYFDVKQSQFLGELTENEVIEFGKRAVNSFVKAQLKQP